MQSNENRYVVVPWRDAHGEADMPLPVNTEAEKTRARAKMRE